MMILIENSCENACKLTDQQRENIARLQELGNILFIYLFY